MAISSTENQTGKEVDFENSIDGFASFKARKMKLWGKFFGFSISKIFKLKIML